MSALPLSMLSNLQHAAQKGLWPLCYLATGSTASVLSQVMVNMGIACPRAQLITTVKYGIAFVMSLVVNLATTMSSKGKQADWQSKEFLRKAAYVSLMGVMDIAAYMLFTVGFASCGAALASVVQSAIGQISTATLRRTVLHRPLSTTQYLAVFLVVTGLIIRSMPSLLETGGFEGTPDDIILGLVCIAGAAFTYSLLGVAYEGAMTQIKGIAHAEINLGMATVGAMSTTAYQAIYTWPNRQDVVVGPIIQSGISPSLCLTWYLALGALFTGHAFFQGKVLECHGAQTLGIVNAVRSSAVSIISGMLFCSVEQPWLCLTLVSALSAGVVSGGGLTWTLAKPPKSVEAAKETHEKKYN